MTAVAEPPKSDATSVRHGSRLLGAAFALAVVAVGLAWWFYSQSQAAQQELAAKAELAELGALVVMDAQRKHVNSVNLSTLKSPETLDRAMALLPALTRLKSLNADGTQLTDAHAPLVGKLTTLQDLILSNTAITDEGLEELAPLSGLNTLYLVNTEVTNAGMPSIGQLESLKILDLSETKVTGNFKPLQLLSNLNWLVAQGLTLDAEAIRALGQCEGLTRLTLREATYPEEEVNQLLQQRPQLTVDR